MKITLKSKMEKKSFLALSLMMLVAASVNAQVIIGSVTDAPHAGAILDLKSANKGMLLPNVALYDAETLTVGNSIADEDQSAVGMVVFNTNAYALDGTGVYVWDGTKWNGINVSGKEIIPTISTCHSNYYEPDATKYVDIKVRNTLGSTSDSLTMRFLTYNLGANPNIAGDNATPAEIAKAQMAYVSENQGFASEDITVLGGLFQWGRKDVTHSLRCPVSGDSFTTEPYNSISYNPATDTKFVYGDALLPSGDWVSPHFNADNRWGNGGSLAEQTSTSYISGTPNPTTNNANNPCPFGFRVPTEHEWALLGNEGGSSTSSTNDGFNTTGGTSGTTPASGIIWVPVNKGHPDTAWNTGNDEGNQNYSDLCGYALYTQAEWNSNKPKTDLSAEEAPNPLLFLPATGIRDYYNGGVMQFVGGSARYWSSTVGPSPGQGFLMYFDQVNVRAYDGGHRAYGRAIRCISGL